MKAHWTTTYDDIAHANEEVISDHIRVSYMFLVAGWLFLIVLLFVTEYENGSPSATDFLYNIGVASLGVFAFYLALVGVRYFTHARPKAWHLTTWSIIILFLIVCTAYFFLVEGPGLDFMLSALVLVCVYIYHHLMHDEHINWEIDDKGVTQEFRFHGHTQTYRTTWKEVRKHKVHPQTGAVELGLCTHHLHWRPRVRLIVPDKRHRHEIHMKLAPILKRKK